MERELQEAIGAAVKQVWGEATRVSTVLPLAGDASTRRYFRLRLEGGGPSSTVAMVMAGSALPLSSEELAIFSEPLKELPYLNLYRFLRPLGVRVPDLYYDGSAQGFLLLEDIGDTSLREVTRTASSPEVERFYRMAIDQLLLIQLDGTRRRNESCIAFQQRFDHRLFRWEFEHFIEFGLEKRWGRPLWPSEGRELREIFDEISHRLDQQPAYLNNRDYHSWNLFVHQGEIRVIDFQDALLAPASYDLATLLNDRDTPEVIPLPLEKSLVEYYRTQWEERGGSRFDSDTLWEVYNLALLQKAHKVVGRFYYLELEKGKQGYLRYIPPTLTTIRRALARLPEYAHLQAILARHFPEMA